jgi:hypothetical protein
VRPLADACDLHRPVCVRQPVEADAEGERVEPRDVSLHVEARLCEHPGGEVDDPDLKAVSLEVLTEEGEADRVHLEESA